MPIESTASKLALKSIDGIAGAEAVRAQLLSALAAAYMLDRRLDEAIEYGEQSRVLSQAIGDEEAGLNTAATLGSVLLFAGESDAGWAMLDRATSRSVSLYHEAEAARGYRMVGTSASVLVEYDRAEKWLSTGISYAESVELWNHRSYMAAHLAHVQWACGEWQAAERNAEQSLADGRGGITTRITAQYVLGYLAMGRADWGGATELLGEALALGESMAELQRISPPLWGLAETALLRGDHGDAIALCERGFELSDEVCDAAYLFPFLLTGTRARLAHHDADGAQDWISRVEKVLARRAIRGTLPAIDHARGLLELDAAKNRRGARQPAQSPGRVERVAPVLGGQLGVARRSAMRGPVATRRPGRDCHRAGTRGQDFRHRRRCEDTRDGRRNPARPAKPAGATVASAVSARVRGRHAGRGRADQPRDRCSARALAQDGVRTRRAHPRQARSGAACRDRGLGRPDRHLMARRLALVGAPTSAGSYAAGQEAAPRVLRELGLVDRLRAAGREVIDAGDGPHQVWKPDPAHRYAQNLDAVVDAVRAVASQVGAAYDQDADVLVIGGNCTIALGVMDALTRRHDHAGLLYIDRHFDLNTPASTTDGALDWMGLAHGLGLPGPNLR